MEKWDNGIKGYEMAIVGLAMVQWNLLTVCQNFFRLHSKGGAVNKSKCY